MKVNKYTLEDSNDVTNSNYNDPCHAFKMKSTHRWPRFTMQGVSFIFFLILMRMLREMRHIFLCFLAKENQKMIKALKDVSD